MGTRSNICRQNADGSYDVIYCHWDGYPSNNGKLLYENYQSPEKIDELLKLGNLSSLGEEIGIKHPFEYDLNLRNEHIAKYGKMCTSYGRDREEKGVDCKHYASYTDLCEMLEDAWTEWVYTYRVTDSKWYYTNNPSPTWFKCCGEQRQTDLLTPAAWAEEDNT